MKEPIMGHVCKCANCDTYFEDTNPQTGAQSFNVVNLKPLDNHNCPICKTDEYLLDIVDEDVHVNLTRTFVWKRSELGFEFDDADLKELAENKARAELKVDMGDGSISTSGDDFSASININ